MNNKILVSIIVPVYNVEKYIRRCFLSIASQTYKNIECIFVDDCGIDNSIPLLEELIFTYSGEIDFKIVTHKENRGLSAARNTGIRVANGEYVYFLDSDDIITSDCIDLLVEPLATYNIDFVMGEIASGGESAFFENIKEQEALLEGNNNIRVKFIQNRWYSMAWNHLVKKDFLLKNNLFFEEGLLHEDIIWSFKLACCAESIYFVHSITYIYLIRRQSIVTNWNIKNLSSLVRIADLRDDFIVKNKIVCPITIAWSIRQREMLIFIAKRLGFEVMWNVYCKNIWPIRSRKNFSICQGLNKIQYLNHYLPKILGFIYSTILIKIINYISNFKGNLIK